MDSSRKVIDELLSDYAMHTRQYSASTKLIAANSNTIIKGNKPGAYRQSELTKLHEMSPEEVVSYTIDKARNEPMYITEPLPAPEVKYTPKHTQSKKIPKTEPKSAKKEEAPELSYISKGFAAVNEQITRIANLPPRYLAGMFAGIIAISAGATTLISGMSSKAEAQTMHNNQGIEQRIKENEESAQQKIDTPAPTQEEIMASEAEIKRRLKQFYEPVQGDELAERCYKSTSYPVPASQPANASASQPALVEVARTYNGTKIYSPFGAKPFRIVSGFDSRTTAVSFIERNDHGIICENPSGEDVDDKVICYRKHNATDVALIDRLNDSIVYPLTEGRVTKIVKGPNCVGNYAEVEHTLVDGKKMRATYVHIKQFSPELEEYFRRTGARNIATFKNNDGPIVKPYTARENGIGIIGGLFGMHLHLEMSIDGKMVDPVQYLPPATPHQFPKKLATSIPYDTKYRDALTHISKVLGLAPGLMQSVRRAEAGDMKAISSANCRGFMQIKESTARKLPKVCAGMPELSDFCDEISWESVTNDPWVNMLAGATLFRSNLSLLGGNYVKAVAAYNAGAGSVLYAVKRSNITGFHFIAHMPSNIPSYVNGIIGTTVYRPKQASPSSQPSSQPAPRQVHEPIAPASQYVVKTPSPAAPAQNKSPERKPIPAITPPASAPAPAASPDPKPEEKNPATKGKAPQEDDDEDDEKPGNQKGSLI